MSTLETSQLRFIIVCHFTDMKIMKFGVSHGSLFVSFPVYTSPSSFLCVRQNYTMSSPMMIQPTLICYLKNFQGPIQKI
jgi:hypothetical protein